MTEPNPEAPIRPNREVRRKLKKTAFRAQCAEKLNVDLAYEIEGDNGYVLVVESPLFEADDTAERIAKVQRNEDLDRDENGKIKEPQTITVDGVPKPAPPQQVRLAQAIVGAEVHAQALANGLNSSDVMLAYRLLAEDRPEVESDPKSQEPSAS